MIQKDLLKNEDFQKNKDLKTLTSVTTKGKQKKDKICTADTGVAIEIKREAKRPEHKMKKANKRSLGNRVKAGKAF